MVTMFRLAFSTLRAFWKVVLLMIFLFANTVFAYLLLNGYRDSTSRIFQTIDNKYLVIHETDTSAEFYGSRLSPDIGTKLDQLGLIQVVPAIHTATGTLGRDFQFILGVDISQYRLIEKIEILAGRELKNSDPERTAMVGRAVAEREGIQVGNDVILRGRSFRVVGIFETHSFYDNDVWISLSAAQNLLGWGSDVSYYLVPDEGILQAGEAFTEHTLISQRGQSMNLATDEIIKTIDLFSLTITIIGIGTAIALGTVIFRLTTIQRYHLAILRSVGFSRAIISINILIQAGVIFIVGFSLGVVSALIFSSLYHLVIFDITMKPDLGFSNLITPFLALGGIALISVTIPLMWVYRTNLSSLLRSE
jgi:ABC-type lipoprotein release transport system permease subunit